MDLSSTTGRSEMAPVETITLWRRTIPVAAEARWLERLVWIDMSRLAISGLIDKPTLRIEVYHPTELEAERLLQEFGGRIVTLVNSQWQVWTMAKPWRASKTVAIAADAAAKASWDALHPTCPALIVPASMAFGSGEHGTTRMILRQMGRLDFSTIHRVLDVGSGSGILALAARRLGAISVHAFDFDPDAVRISFENEAANFASPTITWRTADVLKIRPGMPFDLLLCNLFSDLLVSVHSKLWELVKSEGGHLILSGILRNQLAVVRATFDRLPGSHLATMKRDGKWVMLHYQSMHAKRNAGLDAPPIASLDS